MPPSDESKPSLAAKKAGVSAPGVIQDVTMLEGDNTPKPKPRIRTRYAQEAPIVSVDLGKLLALIPNEQDYSSCIVESLIPSPKASGWSMGPMDSKGNRTITELDQSIFTRSRAADDTNETMASVPRPSNSRSDADYGSRAEPKAERHCGRPADGEQGEATRDACEQSETTDDPHTPPGELNDRECEILVALFLLDAVTERRRRLRFQVARKAHSHSPPSTYNRPIASLVRRGLVRSKKARNGGIWLTPSGVTAAQLLQGQTHQ